MARKAEPETKPKPDIPSSGDKGKVSDEDKNLWRHVTREAEPLSDRDFQVVLDKLDDDVIQPTTPGAGPKAPRKKSAPAGVAPRARKPPPPELSHGTVAGLDKRNAERLKRGKLPVEASLDLHGMTQAQAHGALGDFLAESQHRGRRCVLVVTGKGLARESGGVLRNQAPRWLNEAGNRARILAFTHAQPQHGGSGALYVLLKRRRDS